MDKHPSSQGLVKLFAYYKELAEKALAQVKDEDLHCVFGDDGNSIAVLMQHIAGNGLLCAQVRRTGTIAVGRLCQQASGDEKQQGRYDKAWIGHGHVAGCAEGRPVHPPCSPHRSQFHTRRC